MATKTPAKGKKVAVKDGAPKRSAAPKSRDPEGDDDEEPAPPVAAKKPAPKRAAAEAVDPPPVVPARRLTPEAKAQVNAMVAKGIPLGEALKVAASWETFVAPVKEEPAKLVQGKPGEPGAPKAPFRAGDDDAEEREEEEPAADDGED